MGNTRHFISIIKTTLKIAGVVLFLAFAFIGKSQGFLVDSDKIHPINEDWTLSHPGGVQTNVNLPFNFTLDKGVPFTIERTIKAEELQYPVLRLRSSMTDMKVSIGDEEIYSWDVSSTESWFHNPYPSSWQFIDLPLRDYTGEKLKITYMSPTKEFSGYLNPVVLGAGEALIIDIYNSNRVNFLVSVLIGLLSLFSLSILPWMKKFPTARKHIIYLAVFGLFSSLWILSESTLLQFITPNRFIIGSISYILNVLMPLTVLLFFRDIVLKGFKKIFTITATILTLLVIAEFLLQITGVIPYISTTVYSIIGVAFTSILIIATLSIEGFRKKNFNARRYLFIFLILFIFVAVIMIIFLMGAYHDQSIYLSLGVLIFFILVMKEAIQSIAILVEHKNQAIIFKRLAYEDFLTKGRNRTSFEEDIEKYQKEGVEFRLVLMDLNHLKMINDTYGHTEGDNAIKSACNALSLEAGTTGKCYRISGDEFAAVMEDTNEELFLKFSNGVKERLEEVSGSIPYDIVLAFGSKIYRDKTDFKAFYKEVDSLMYEHKKALKENVLG